MAYKQVVSYFIPTDSSENEIPIGFKVAHSETVDFDFLATETNDSFYESVLSKGVYAFTVNYILQAVDPSGCEVIFVQMTMLPNYDPESNLVRWSYPNVLLGEEGSRNYYSFNGIFNVTETTNVRFATEVSYEPDGVDVIKRTGFSIELIRIS